MLPGEKKRQCFFFLFGGEGNKNERKLEKKINRIPFLSTLSLLVLVKEMECFSLSRKLYCSYCLPGKHMRIIFNFTSLVLPFGYAFCITLLSRWWF